MGLYDTSNVKYFHFVRTKAHLVEEIGGYTKKMSQDYEDIDQLSIQADMWRSKYMASRYTNSDVIIYNAYAENLLETKVKRMEYNVHFMFSGF